MDSEKLKEANEIARKHDDALSIQRNAERAAKYKGDIKTIRAYTGIDGEHKVLVDPADFDTVLYVIKALNATRIEELKTQFEKL